jgi:crotonobetainyl-CoA:carnitine CoA-transferase CaiB-like acyl-CoA transferase
MSRYPQPEALGPTPDLGEHTGEILAGLGYGSADIGTLKAKGVI